MRAVLILLVGLLSLRCSDAPVEHQPVELVLTSPSFGNGDVVPDAYTCTGSGLAPPLEWTGMPPGAKSIALSLEKVGPGRSMLDDRTSADRSTDVDPDPLLWLVYNLPPDATSLPEGYSMRNTGETREEGFVDALNFFGSRGYDGPCPPKGDSGRYVFRVYALGDVLRNDRDASAYDVRRTMAGLIVGKGELFATYGYPTQ